MTSRWSGFVRSRDKFYTLYLQGADLPWEASTIKATLLIDHATNARLPNSLKVYLSTFARLMVTNFGRVLTLGSRLSPLTLKLSPNSCFFQKDWRVYIYRIYLRFLTFCKCFILDNLAFVSYGKLAICKLAICIRKIICVINRTY